MDYNNHYVRRPLKRPLASHIDYSEIFPPDILASNIDFLIERHGEFLVIEFKGRNETLTEGQRILLTNLSKLPEFTVLVFERNGVTEKFPDREIVARNNDELISYIREWKRKRGLR